MLKRRKKQPYTKSPLTMHSSLKDEPHPNYREPTSQDYQLEESKIQEISHAYFTEDEEDQIYDGQSIC